MLARSHYRPVQCRAMPCHAVPRAEPSRAGPSRAEPCRAVPSRAEPCRAVPSRAVPSRAVPSRAEPYRGMPLSCSAVPWCSTLHAYIPMIVCVKEITAQLGQAQTQTNVQSATIVQMRRPCLLVPKASSACREQRSLLTVFSVRARAARRRQHRLNS